MRLMILFAASAATLVATPAPAQAFPSDTAQANARGVVLQSHSLQNNGDLDFGIVAVDPLTPGTVVIESSAAGTRSATGGVTLLPSTPHSARFDGVAAPAETVVLTLNPPAGNVLNDTSNTHTVAVNAMSVDAAGLTRQADANGNFTVYVGGNFGLAANQASGVYSATFRLTAEYQ